MMRSTIATADGAIPRGARHGALRRRRRRPAESMRRAAGRAPALPQPADRPADDLYVEHARPPGEAAGDLATSRSRGQGPMELRGRRNGPRSMRVNQRIYKTARGHITVADPGDAALHRRRRVLRRQLLEGPRPGRVRALVGRRHRHLPARGARGPEAELLPPRPRAHPAGRRSPRPPTTPAATRTPARTGSRSGPRSAGRTSTRPTTTSSGSTSPACAAASPSSCGSTREPLLRVRRARQPLGPARPPSLPGGPQRC